MTYTGTTHYRDGFKVFLGDCLQGRVFSPWTVGIDYDFEYRLEWIKTNSEYSEFYHVCPLNGLEYIGGTLDEAMDSLDLLHAEAYKEDAESEIKRIKEKRSSFTFDDIPF